MAIALGSSSATLLDGVNYVLKKAKLIHGDASALTSLTDPARQLWIDQIVESWNVVVEELYSNTGLALPKAIAEDTITLASGTRAYQLNSSLNILLWPLLDETNGQYIYEYEEGYIDLVQDQPVPSDYTGLPNYAVIRPTDGYLYLDRIPSSSEDGLVYKYRYEKDISLSAYDDTFPFSNSVFRALVPAVNERFRLDHENEFSQGTYDRSMGQAARYLTQLAPRNAYLTRQYGYAGIFQPFNE
jgi:hypothetical protein